MFQYFTVDLLLVGDLAVVISKTLSIAFIFFMFASKTKLYVQRARTIVWLQAVLLSISLFVINISTADLLTKLFNFSTVPNTSWIKIVSAVLISPILEEVIFRGTMFSLFKRKTPLFIILLITSALFSLYHSNLGGYPIYFIGGWIFGLMYYQTRNIWVPILMHCICNAFVCIYNYNQVVRAAVSEVELLLTAGATFMLLAVLYRKHFLGLIGPEDRIER